MYMIKVANSRDSGEFIRFPAEDTTEEGGIGRTQPPPAAAPMYTGYSHSGKTSATVTALTHVVSGQRSGDLTYYSPELSGGAMVSFGSGSGGGSGIYTPNSLSSGYSSSNPGSWAGQKRTRNEESSVTQFSGQQFPRVHRGIESSYVSAG